MYARIDAKFNLVFCFVYISAGMKACRSEEAWSASKCEMKRFGLNVICSSVVVQPL